MILNYVQHETVLLKEYVITILGNQVDIKHFLCVNNFLNISFVFLVLFIASYIY